jgi:LytS/YehU family sensor histidine kinase
VLRYHERTKHHLNRFAAGPGRLDWANQPDPFRRYEGAALARLPLLGANDEPLSPIDNYIRIQQVRFGDRMKFVKQVDFTCLGVHIPPMILQPLVENSVKYGIAPKDDGGTIILTVKRFNNMIFFEVKDDGLGSKAKKVMDGSSSGVGISNTDQRLRSIFGPGSGLRIRSNEWGYSVSFFIPFEDAKYEQTPIHDLKSKAV